jgi:hypothetical protein
MLLLGKNIYYNFEKYLWLIDVKLMVTLRVLLG